MNKKVKELARKSALTYKVQDNMIKVIENFSFEAPKTKDFVKLAQNLEAEGKKVLLVVENIERNVALSVRNVPNARVMRACDLNTYAVMTPIVTEKATKLQEKLNRYTFRVSPDANKYQIKSLVEQLYGVKVEAVNTMQQRGKNRSRWTRSGLLRGKTEAYKQAIVTLADGETIDFYSNI